MKELFNRSAEVVVGSKTAGSIPLLNALNAIRFPGGVTLQSLDPEIRRSGGFRISFDVDKTSESLPNSSRISIHNLSPKSRADLEASGLSVRLSAGYAGIGDGDPIISQIFSGDIRFVSTVRQGPNLVTTIEAGDAETAIKTAQVDQAFPPFVGLPQIFLTLASKLGVAIGKIAPSASKVFQDGLSLTGPVASNLDDLTKSAGLEWHVTDGELNILELGGSTDEVPIFISPETGLIGAVGKRKAGQEVSVLGNKDRSLKDLGGIEFRSLIRPGISPGRKVYVESDNFTGVVKVRRAHFRGDTHEGDFVVEVEAE